MFFNFSALYERTLVYKNMNEDIEIVFWRNIKYFKYRAEYICKMFSEKGI